MKDLRGPLDGLLVKDAPFQWQPKQETAFRDLKKILSSNLILAHFDPNQRLILATDASNYGIGAQLMHRASNGMLKTIACASSSLTSAEKNYSQIDKEARGIVYGVLKFHQYLYGRKFTLHTDHEPLLRIFGSKTGIPGVQV